MQNKGHEIKNYKEENRQLVNSFFPTGYTLSPIGISKIVVLKNILGLVTTIGIFRFIKGGFDLMNDIHK